MCSLPAEPAIKEPWINLRVAVQKISLNPSPPLTHFSPSCNLPFCLRCLLKEFLTVCHILEWLELPLLGYLSVQNVNYTDDSFCFLAAIDTKQYFPISSQNASRFVLSTAPSSAESAATSSNVGQKSYNGALQREWVVLYFISHPERAPSIQHLSVSFWSWKKSLYCTSIAQLNNSTWYKRSVAKQWSWCVLHVSSTALSSSHLHSNAISLPLLNFTTIL